MSSENTSVNDESDEDAENAETEGNIDDVWVILSDQATAGDRVHIYDLTIVRQDVSGWWSVHHDGVTVDFIKPYWFRSGQELLNYLHELQQEAKSRHGDSDDANFGRWVQ